MTKRKRATLWLTAAAMTMATVCGVAAGINKAEASVRERVIFDEKFNLTTINENNWFMVDGEEENKITLEYGGDEGTLTLNQGGSWFEHIRGGVFHKTPVTVADDEDLVISYDFIKGPEGGGSAAYYFGMVKGAQMDSENKIALTDSAAMEEILVMKLGLTQDQSMLGYFVGDSYNAHTGYGDTEAFKEYISDAAHRTNYYMNLTYSVNMKTGLSATTPASFRADGYTYKHVYRAAGGYACYAKPIGAEDSEFVQILNTADTYGEDSFHSANSLAPEVASQKIFTNRSGHVGFILNGEKSVMNIDNYKVSTVKGGTENVVINDTFNRSGPQDEYKPNDNWYYGNADSSMTADYPSSGLRLDNPSEANYLYSTADIMLNNSGIYEDYVKFTTDFTLEALSGGKEFGVIFGGERGADRLETDGVSFVYFFNDGGVIKLGADAVVNGARVPLGTPVATGIVPAVPSDPENPDVITMEILGKLNGSVTVSLKINGTEDVSQNFADDEIKVSLQKRFAFIMNGEETGDTGVAVLKSVKAVNKWVYHMEDTVSKSVAENFNAVDEDGAAYINEDDMFVINKKGGYSSDSEAGIYVDEGKLKFVAGGQGGGVAVRYAYDNWKMTFDITDMQREVLYAADGETVVRTVCNAPIIICFGMQAEGVGYTTGKALTLNFATTIDGTTVAKVTDPGYESSIGLSSDVLKSEIIGLASVGGTRIKEGFARHQFIDPALDGYTIRVQVEFNDGRLTCGYVVMGLEDYSNLFDPVLVYENVDGEGYVGISTTHNLEGSFSGTFSIDNLKVVDTDSNSVIPDDVVPAKPEVTPPPTPNPDDGKDAPKDNKVLVAVITGVAALVVGAAGCFTVMYFIGKKKNKKA